MGTDREGVARILSIGLVAMATSFHIKNSVGVLVINGRRRSETEKYWVSYFLLEQAFAWIGRLHIFRAAIPFIAC